MIILSNRYFVVRVLSLLIRSTVFLQYLYTWDGGVDWSLYGAPVKGRVFSGSCGVGLSGLLVQVGRHWGVRFAVSLGSGLCGLQENQAPTLCL